MTVHNKEFWKEKLSGENSEVLIAAATERWTSNPHIVAAAKELLEERKNPRQDSAALIANKIVEIAYRCGKEQYEALAMHNMPVIMTSHDVLEREKELAELLSEVTTKQTAVVTEENPPAGKMIALVGKTQRREIRQPVPGDCRCESVLKLQGGAFSGELRIHERSRNQEEAWHRFATGREYTIEIKPKADGTMG